MLETNTVEERGFKGFEGLVREDVEKIVDKLGEDYPNDSIQLREGYWSVMAARQNKRIDLGCVVSCEELYNEWKMASLSYINGHIISEITSTEEPEGTYVFMVTPDLTTHTKIYKIKGKTTNEALEYLSKVLPHK